MTSPEGPKGRGKGRSDSTRRGEEYFRNLVYTKSNRPRFTQDSPILPDVFIRYGTLPEKQLDLLLTPDWSKTAGEVAFELSGRMSPAFGSAEIPVANRDSVPLDAEDAESRPDPEIAFNHSVVAVRLGFEDLVCRVLPLSGWWHNRLIAIPGLDPVSACRSRQARKVIRGELIAALQLETGDLADHECDKRTWRIRQDLAWAARVFWVVQHSNRPDLPDEPDDCAERIATYLLDDLLPRIADLERESRTRATRSTPWVYSVSRNRELRNTVLTSITTTKADAATQTFDVRGDGIRWAVVDTGIDAKHVAFRKIQDNGTPYPQPFGADGANHTRIKATFDFSNIRQHLSREQRQWQRAGRMLDWDAIEDALKGELRVPHTTAGYRTPMNPHGTHVAGILGADWRVDSLPDDPIGPPANLRAVDTPFKGLCPEIELYDLRVFREDGTGDEFAVMSALQFVRRLNQRHDALEIHGVNLSLAMDHDVSNYACGRSPVCEECNRLVGNGVVVVAAAGNEGRSVHTTPQLLRKEGYRTVSIADPGNAEAVITVGSTHRLQPHTYGVSYFSSRGPTGDGRAKPDLVAPGEKIVSTVPGDRLEQFDGTSQAAPHVSGAAALLMCRHSELRGDPVFVKKVLMETATDLGRERHFQGAGLVDVMRAIQSI